MIAMAKVHHKNQYGRVWMVSTVYADPAGW